MDTKTLLKITSLPISRLPERHGRYWVHPVDDGTVHGPSFNRETENAVDSNSMAGGDALRCTL